MVSPTKGTTNPSPSKSKRYLKVKVEKDEEEKGLWTTRRMEILLEVLEEAKAKLTGNVHGRNFSPKMKQIATEVKRNTGYDFSDTQVKNYWTRLKKTHGAFLRMSQQTGITCNREEGTIIAEEHTWRDVLLPMNYTECKRIKEHGFPLFLRIDAIIGGARATGSRAHPSCISPSVTASSADPSMKFGEDVDEGFIEVDSGKGGRKRKSIDKVKTVMYEKGGSSGSKRKGESFSTVFANSVSGLQQSLDFRTRTIATEKGIGSSDCMNNEGARMRDQLSEAIQKLNAANLTAKSAAKALLLFSSKEQGSTWTQMFHQLDLLKWEATLEHIPWPGPKTD